MIWGSPGHLVVNINVSLLYAKMQKKTEMKKHKALLSLFLSMEAFQLGGGGPFAPPHLGYVYYKLGS